MSLLDHSTRDRQWRANRAVMTGRDGDAAVKLRGRPKSGFQRIYRENFLPSFVIVRDGFRHVRVAPVVFVGQLPVAVRIQRRQQQVNVGSAQGHRGHGGREYSR